MNRYYLRFYSCLFVRKIHNTVIYGTLLSRSYDQEERNFHCNCLDENSKSGSRSKFGVRFLSLICYQRNHYLSPFRSSRGFVVAVSRANLVSKSHQNRFARSIQLFSHGRVQKTIQSTKQFAKGTANQIRCQ